MAIYANILDKSRTKVQLIHDLQSLRQKTADADRLLNDVLAMYKKAPIGLCVFDLELKFKHINDWLAAINGVPAEEHLGRSIFEILPHVALVVERQLLQVIETSEPIIGGTVEAETPADPGTKMAFKHNYYPITSNIGTVVGVSCVVENVTEQLQAERGLLRVHNELEERVAARTGQLNNINTRLREEIAEHRNTEKRLKTSELKFRSVLKSAYDGVIMLKADGVLELVNDKLLQMTGYRREELVGHVVEELIPKISVNHAHYRQRFFKNASSRTMGTGIELYLLCRNGEKIPVDISLSPIQIEGETIVTAVIRDISERKKSEQLLAHQASHDALTGLVNRREFERRADRLLVSCKHSDEKHVLCFMDLDQFKLVNDTCNHSVGDEVLRSVSSLLAGGLRKRDTLARLGGDEFGILMEHCSLQYAYRVTRSLQLKMQNFLFECGRHKFKIGMSAGIVGITRDTSTIAGALKQADEACYLSKEQGRGRINIYHSDDTELIQRETQTRMIEMLYQAIENNLFLVYAQAISHLDGRPSLHHEILLRMRDENGRVLLPGDFLATAERFHLIEKIDLWVIETVFNLLAKNTAYNTHNGICFINLSGNSLTKSDVLDLIMKKLVETGIRGNKICFEITETAAISDLSKAIEFVATLKKMGCRFALDDFGSGMCSYAYLKIFPVEYIKIDSMFVNNIAHNPIDYTMVKSIHDISHLMGKQTIAEGVENGEILAKLAEIGVDYIQGYIVEYPRPVDAKTWNPNKVLEIG